MILRPRAKSINLSSLLTGVLPIANGGTAATTASDAVTSLFGGQTGTGDAVRKTSPTLTTPNLGTPSAATLTNATGLPLTTGVTGTLPIANGGTNATTGDTAITSLFGGYTGTGDAVRKTSPTLTTPTLGAATYTSFASTAAPSYSGNFVTAYPSKFVNYYNGTTVNATLPEIGSYVELHSTVGYANRATAYKIASGGLNIDDSGAAGNAADLYGLNYVVHGHGGAGGSLLVGCEIDVNNIGANATTLGANNSVYAYVAAIGGSYRGTAAFWNAGIPNAQGWQYGFASSGVVGSTSFYDESNSPTVLGGSGTHTNGVDLTGMTLTTAFKSTGYTLNGSGTVTSGLWNGTKIGLAYGGTNADLSATGGASQVLKQTSAGGNITVGQLGVSDLSGFGTGVATALGVNTGTAGSVVVNGGALGTPSSGTLTNATGLPISTGVSGLATGVATFLATPSSANLAAALTDEVGSGKLPFGVGDAWTAYTPTVTAVSGSITTLGAVSGRYLQVGKLLHFSVNVAVTNIGTAGGGLNVTFPNSLTANGAQVVIGRENTLSGNIVYGYAPNGGSGITVYTATAGFPVASGGSVVLSGVVEVS